MLKSNNVAESLSHIFGEFLIMVFKAVNSITMNPLSALSQFPQSKIVGSERTEVEFEPHLTENKQKKSTRIGKRHNLRHYRKNYWRQKEQWKITRYKPTIFVFGLLFVCVYLYGTAQDMFMQVKKYLEFMLN